MGTKRSRDVLGVPMEKLKQKYPSFYENRPDTLNSEFADPGDRVKIRGDEAEVKHVEQNTDGSQDVYLQRSSQLDSGTYKMRVEQGKDRKQYVGELKRTFD